MWRFINYIIYNACPFMIKNIAKKIFNRRNPNIAPWGIPTTLSRQTLKEEMI